MKALRVVYMAHPVSGNVEENLARARRWVRWIYDHYPNVVVLAHWIVDCEVLDDANPAHREKGLAHDFAIIRRCDEIWLVGGRVSEGMGLESAYATDDCGLPALDLTYLGPEPPQEKVALPPLAPVQRKRTDCRRTV
jgi:hypothetical protein